MGTDPLRPLKFPWLVLAEKVVLLETPLEEPLDDELPQDLTRVGGTDLLHEALLGSEVEGVDPLHKRLEVVRGVGEESGLEVASLGALAAHPGAGEVGGADKGGGAIDNDGLGVDAGAEDALEEFALDEDGVVVKVFPEAWAGFGLKRRVR